MDILNVTSQTHEHQNLECHSFEHSSLKRQNRERQKPAR